MVLKKSKNEYRPFDKRIDLKSKTHQQKLYDSLEKLYSIIKNNQIYFHILNGV